MRAHPKVDAAIVKTFVTALGLGGIVLLGEAAASRTHERHRSSESVA